MQPQKVPVTQLFSAPYQYQIPVFQRGYVWTLEKQVISLWADVADRANALLDRRALPFGTGTNALRPIAKHFLGSIVLAPIQNSFGRVGAYEVIDGQQRTTTLHLLILALRHSTQQLSDSPLPQMLEVLVRNPGPYPNHSDDHHKVWPTQAGRQEMKALDEAPGADAICKAYPVKIEKCVDGKRRVEKIERPLMIQAYLYLYHACLAYLRGIDLGDAVDAASERTISDALVNAIRGSNVIEPLQAKRDLQTDRSEILFTTLNENIQLMTLSLDAEDDPQVIFETLNARGEPLLASDLIRNLVFLEAARDGKAVTTLYDTYWKPFDEQSDDKKVVGANRYWREKERQGRLTYPRIDLFFFHYTILRSQHETLATHVFHAFKEWWHKDRSDLDSELSRIVKSSEIFRELISPEGTTYVAEFGRLIKTLDVSSITPVYMALRERLEADSDSLRHALGDLASYLTRRAVCGLTTKGYNRIFMRLLEVVTSAHENPEVALREALLKLGGDSQRWPTDEEFSERWFNRPIYRELRPAKVCAVLRALEYASRGSFQGSQEVPEQAKLTVEHVLPQTWERDGHYPVDGMTDERRLARNHMVQTFGNLTLLTGPLNSSVSNGPFLDIECGEKMIEGKKAGLAKSALVMNTYFSRPVIHSWDDSAIRERARSTLAAALLVWARPVEQFVIPRRVSDALAGKCLTD
jgi:hypothetical protein